MLVQTMSPMGRVAAILAIVFGIIIIAAPQVLAILIGIYLIVIGILYFVKRK
ncbi:hypothetical protein ES703_37855 [subsurface metagenome]